MNLIIRPPENEQEMKSCFELRWISLRKPWDQPKGSEQDEKESECIHIAAFDQDGVPRATGRLQFNSHDESQVRYMAVDPAFRNQGIGALVLEALEEQARIHKSKYIVLEARDLAVPFYKRAGYEITEKTFLLYNDIQHYRMKKVL
jgi:ribosomal protein S18 acetylase RimI-like enzyme